MPPKKRLKFGKSTDARRKHLARASETEEQRQNAPNLISSLIRGRKRGQKTPVKIQTSDLDEIQNIIT